MVGGGTQYGGGWYLLEVGAEPSRWVDSLNLKRLAVWPGAGFRLFWWVSGLIGGFPPLVSSASFWPFVSISAGFRLFWWVSGSVADFPTVSVGFQLSRCRSCLSGGNGPSLPVR